MLKFYRKIFKRYFLMFSNVYISSKRINSLEILKLIFEFAKKNFGREEEIILFLDSSTN
jgi:hypothetical protein